MYDRAARSSSPGSSGSRRVVTYDEIPPLVLDATTGAEDRTFWANQGYDLRPSIAASTPQRREVAGPRPSPSSSSARGSCPRT